MDVADVEGIGRRDGSLGDTVRTRDDQVETSQVKELDSQGEERQVVAILLLHEGQPLEKARPDIAALDDLRLASLEMEKGKDRSPGENLGQDLEHFLAPSLAGQPVMDQGDLDVIHRR